MFNMRVKIIGPIFKIETILYSSVICNNVQKIVVIDRRTVTENPCKK